MTDLRILCHRHRGGPYTGGASLLRRIIPELVRIDPRLVGSGSWAVIAVAADLARIVPVPPRSLTELAQGRERTRNYSALRTREISYVITELVNLWISHCHSDGARITFSELDQADPTDVELVGLLRRRCTHAASTIEIADQQDVSIPIDADPAQFFIDSDGTSLNPFAEDAYAQLPEDERRRRHSDRLKLLLDRATPGEELGAIPYHAQRSANPEFATVEIIATALEQCFRSGFYHAAADLARSGRLLAERSEGNLQYQRFTDRLISALMYVGQPDEALDVVRSHRRTTIDPIAQMQCAYELAMLYTRHLGAAHQDNGAALEFANVAIALADCRPLAKDRAFYGAFMRNARALVELRDGNPAGSLALVDAAITVADGGLDPDEHASHRTVLIYNRARILASLGDHQAALRAYDEVVERDPEYFEPYFERADVQRRTGRTELALADLERSLELSSSFVEAHYNRGDLLLDLGREDESLGEFDAVLGIDPDHLPALINRAALRLGRDDLELAGQDITHGLKLEPDNPHLWVAAGDREARLGNGDAALAAYGRALDADPDLVTALGNRAVAYFAQGDTYAAVADLDRAIALDDSAVLRTNRAIGRHRLGDQRAAVADLDAAAGLPGADSAEILRLRAQIS